MRSSDAVPVMAAEADDRDEIWQRFSLAEGGPLFRLSRAIGLPGGRAGLVGLGIVLALVAWIPLAALAAVYGRPETGPWLPFFWSFGTHTRLLIAIPLFFVSEAYFDARVRQALRLAVRARIVPEEERPRLASALQAAHTWRNRWHAEAALLALALLLIWRGVTMEVPIDVPGWRSVNGVLTPAGWWYGVVALPLFQFLLGRWLIRLVVWSCVLWRFERTKLALIPTHPDLAGGLGGLGVAHVTLAPLAFGLSAAIVGTFADQIRFSGVPVVDVVLPLTGLVIGSTLVLIAPLAVFSRRLLSLKQRGLLEYGWLAVGYVRAFDEKWIRSGRLPSDEPLLGSADIQSLADLSGSYEIIDRMRMVPISLRQILILLGAAALPVAPLVLFVIPFDKLVVDGVRALLHL